MSNGRTITIARNHFIAGCVVILVLLVAVLVDKLKSPDVSDDFSELRKVITAEGVSFIPILTGGGTLKLYSPNGKRIEACGKIIDGIIPESCNLKKIDLEKIFAFTIFEYKRNPRCRAVYDENGEYLYDVHKDGTHRGDDPCHDNH